MCQTGSTAPPCGAPAHPVPARRSAALQLLLDVPRVRGLLPGLAVEVLQLGEVLPLLDQRGEGGRVLAGARGASERGGVNRPDGGSVPTTPPGGGGGQPHPSISGLRMVTGLFQRQFGRGGETSHNPQGTTPATWVGGSLEVGSPRYRWGF